LSIISELLCSRQQSIYFQPSNFGNGDSARFRHDFFFATHQQQWPLLLMLYKLFSSVLGMPSCAGDHLAEDLNIVTFGLLLAAVPRHALGFGVSLPTNYQEALNQNTSFGRYSLSSPTLSKQFLQQFATQIQQTFDIGSGLFCR
jgi:hypothetical protein